MYQRVMLTALAVVGLAGCSNSVETPQRRALPQATSRVSSDQTAAEAEAEVPGLKTGTGSGRQGGGGDMSDLVETGSTTTTDEEAEATSQPTDPGMTPPPEGEKPPPQEQPPPQQEQPPPEVVCGARQFKSGNTCLNAIPVYRFFGQSASHVGHFFTTDPNGENSGLGLEGVAFYTLPANGPAGWVTIHRGRKLRKHLWTADLNEMARRSYNYQGPAYSAGAGQFPGTVPLYRFFNTTSGDRLYTLAANGEGARGYILEGIVGYVFP